jgi:hypothetical protein
MKTAGTSIPEVSATTTRAQDQAAGHGFVGSLDQEEDGSFGATE